MTKKEPRLSHQTLRVLRLFLDKQPNEVAGSEISKETKMLTGTIYPIVMRLERFGWLKSRWEKVEPSVVGRPRRRLYRLTALGYNKTHDALSELGVLDTARRTEWTS